jgi:RNA polymerase sigma-70 factor (ECF subfamily)
MSEIEFSRLMTMNKSYLFGYAYLLTKNRDDASDLLQDTMYRAFKNRRKFIVNLNFRAWIKKIMYNLFVSNYHRKKRLALSSIEEPDGHINFSLEHSRNDGFVNVEMEDVRRAIDQLEDKYKNLIMHFYQGYAYEEMAEKFEIPIGTVKNRMHKARNILKRKLGRN